MKQANYINEYFTNIGPYLAEQFTTDWNYFGEQLQTTFNIHPITDEEPMSVLNKIDTTLPVNHPQLIIYQGPGSKMPLRHSPLILLAYLINP